MTEKILVRFRAVGDAPLLKNPVFKVDGNREFSTIIKGLNYKLKQCSNLHFYINNSFSPSPDEIINNLYKCFGTGNELQVNYATTPAYG
ncbi:autophagy protein 12 [Neocallimastix lanati (nom. inval.)]|uniref:Ubiquitin-like protein ATG12 n=1 Tax=Neocallimastix californiae TaxID=1754190 RepID=A0A1Y2APM5_9FUNG|nr:autophagy protein 12 [Neocallimastix sp. JGI-2020a]ORY24424.1 autophagy protein 12 [Neocallimastix californiae]|eukprot:ORY24424.1 autophagy protein 12 [Neocallimastix californiae]